MARLQILELPSGAGDERPPFILVIDQATEQFVAGVTANSTDIAAAVGARTVCVFEETVEIPANDTTAYLSSEGGDGTTVGAVHVRVEPDFEQFRQQVQDEILRTRDKLMQAVNSRA